jgi:protease I
LQRNRQILNIQIKFQGDVYMRTILIFVHEVYEDLELWYPKIRLEEAGFKTLVAGPEAGKIYNGKHGYPCKSDISIDQIQAESFAGLVIPGGFAPDKLRRIPKVLDTVQQMDKAKKPIAFICHAGWVPISAKILKNRHVTGVSAIKDDLENAGAHFSDKAVVVDGNLISSRTPADLPDFCKAILKAL